MDARNAPGWSNISRIGGFTLIELLVVVAILGVLAAVALPAYSTFQRRAKIARAQAELNTIRKAIETLVVDTGQWPGHQAVGKINTLGTNEVWNLGVSSAGLVSTDGQFPNWQGPYV